MTAPAGKTIGFVSLEIYPATPGGAGILLYHTACRLLEDGYTVVLLLDISEEAFRRLTTSDSLSFPHSERVHILHVDALASESFRLPAVFPDTELKRSARIAAAVDVLLQRFAIDLLEFYDYCGPAYYALGLARMRETRTAIRLHNTVELIDRRTRHGPAPERAYHYALERAQIAGADLLLTPGPAYFAEEIRPLYGPLLDGRRVLSSPPVTRPVMGTVCDGQGQDIVFYGRRSRFKGLDTFVAASLLALKDQDFSEWAARFLIIGPEEPVSAPFDARAMEDMVPERHRDRFHVLGRRSHHDLATDLENAAFACFPHRVESYCYAAHELHLAGVPLILRDSPAFRDHFKADENAVFFDGTARGLSEAMVRLGRDPRMRQRLATSQGRNTPRYRRNFYTDHLRDRLFIPRRPVDREPDALSVLVLILSAAQTSDEAVLRTAKSLDGLSDRVHCLRPCAGPACSAPHTAHASFGGRRWDVFSAQGGPVAPGEGLLEPAGDALLVLRAGDRVQPDWFGEAVQILAARPGVGAVGGWQRRDGYLEVSGPSLLTDPLLLEAMGARVMIRLPKGLLVSECLDQGRAGGDVSLLLAHRAAGRMRIDVPRASVDTTHAVTTPWPDLENAILVDGDRLEPRFLSLMQRLDLPMAAECLPLGGHEAEADLLLQTRINPGLAILRSRPDRAGGEVVLRRLFRGGGFHEPWSAVRFSGPWRHTARQGDPEGGAFRTEQAGQALFLADPSTALEVALGPDCGGADLFFKGEVVPLDLSRSERGTALLGFDDLSKGLCERGRGASLRAGTDDDSSAPFLRILLARTDGRARTLALHGGTGAGLFQTVTRSEGVLTLGAEEIAATGGDRLVPALVAGLRFLVEQRAIDRLILPCDFECGPDLVKTLARLDLPVCVSLVLDPGAAGALADHAPPLDAAASSYADDIDGLTRWLEAAAVLRHRLEVVASTGAYLPLFARQGCEVHRVPPPLPVPPEHDPQAEDGVELLILSDGRLLPSLAHLVTAWMLFEQRNGPAARVWIPQQARHLEPLWTAFGPRAAPRFYGSMAQVSAVPRLSRPLALGVFPEPEPPADLDGALAAGFLPVLGGASTLASGDGPAAGGQVIFWDNAFDIGQEMDRLMADFTAEYAGLRTVLGAQHRALNGFLETWLHPIAPDTHKFDGPALPDGAADVKEARIA
ncbi:MAG: glycosyltransferase [Alphaproteobacteria bacterium]